VVIGQGGRNIAKADALQHVWGYTIVNDVTARDVQMRHGQWHLGKSFDTFCPMGPWLVSADELDGTDTRVRCWVNGALRLKPMQAPSSVRLEPAAAGPVGDWLADAPPAGRPLEIRDPDASANAALRYDMRLGPGEQRTIDVVLPVTAAPLPARLDIGRDEARVAARWRAALDRVGIDGPGEVADIARTLRTALGHVLVNRSGPADGLNSLTARRMSTDAEST
jgi:hypothetical protein